MKEIINKPHNPQYKLIETTVFDGYKFLTLVWGISNTGDNEGLEIYFKKEKDGHFYSSRRYLVNEIPNKYKRYYESLSSRRSLVNDGCKIIIELINE
jgi:hypothetical protein